MGFIWPDFQQKPMSDINELISLIGETQQYFKQQAQRQVNTALTLRNWLFGFYITEYELNGSDRAEYGAKLFKEIANRLEKEGIRQIRERHLYLCNDFYIAYPHILRTVSAKSHVADFQSNAILRTASAKLNERDLTRTVLAQSELGKGAERKSITDSNLLVNRLSFSHIIDKADLQKIIEIEQQKIIRG